MQQVSASGEDGLSAAAVGQLLVFAFQDFYDEQGVFAENFWPQSEPPQAMAFNPRARVSKALTPPPTTQSISNQVSRRAWGGDPDLVQNPPEGTGCWWLW